MMKKIIVLLLIVLFSSSLISPSISAVKKKKVVKKKRYYRRIVRNWPKGGPRPVFPNASGERTIVVVPAPAPKPVLPQPSKPLVKAGFFAEGGMAGGAMAAELGYGRSFGEKLVLSGAAGYAVGNRYGVVVFDPIRATFDLKNLFVGAGLNYAAYSEYVTGIPGFSGTISNKNLFGFEVFAGKQFGDLIGKIGYSTALGLRAGAAMNF
jgi:hypothetical protein